MGRAWECFGSAFTSFCGSIGLLHIECLSNWFTVMLQTRFAIAVRNIIFLRVYKIKKGANA